MGQCAMSISSLNVIKMYCAAVNGVYLQWRVKDKPGYFPHFVLIGLHDCFILDTSASCVGKIRKKRPIKRALTTTGSAL